MKTLHNQFISIHELLANFEQMAAFFFSRKRTVIVIPSKYDEQRGENENPT